MNGYPISETDDDEGGEQQAMRVQKVDKLDTSKSQKNTIL